MPSLNLQQRRAVPARKEGNCLDYLAGEDSVRCGELLAFLLSEEDHIAWFGRGGFGLTRILSELRNSLSQQSVHPPKRWMGYSDITALFALTKSIELPVECIHGPMLCALAEQPNPSQILEALVGLPTPIPVSPTNSLTAFHGTIWGGNLAVLASLCGTEWLPCPNADQAIFLEDIDEAPYRVDRYLTQLADSGFFEHCKRVFLGTFTGFEPASAVSELAERRCLELGLKVLGRLPIGHSEPHYPLFLDRAYRYAPESAQLIPEF
jgi:muramoyltetrapeptide carboxypeptidase